MIKVITCGKVIAQYENNGSDWVNASRHARITSEQNPNVAVWVQDGPVRQAYRNGRAV